ncbi:unnamed protein product [Polarella glacialis]|uniref:Uncharacterized protein n=1 Tax=Polarella glacialis TaxID=89957 RepID=A0A813HU32_POLGL|nr:unnamed protein product [Polarella glacialis]
MLQTAESWDGLQERSSAVDASVEPMPWFHSPSVGTWLLPPRRIEATPASARIEAEQTPPGLPADSSQTFSPGARVVGRRLPPGSKPSASLPRVSVVRPAEGRLVEAGSSPLHSPKVAANAAADVSAWIVAPAGSLADQAVPFGLQELTWCARVPWQRRSSAMRLVVQRAKQSLRRAMERSKVYRKQVVAKRSWAPLLASVYEGGQACNKSNDLECKSEGRVPCADLQHVARPLVLTAGGLPQLRLGALPPPPPKPSGAPVPPLWSCLPQAPAAQRHPMRRLKLGPPAAETSIGRKPLEAQEKESVLKDEDPLDLLASASANEVTFQALTAWLGDLGFVCDDVDQDVCEKASCVAMDLASPGSVVLPPIHCWPKATGAFPTFADAQCGVAA